jgi:hypothetical protein
MPVDGNVGKERCTSEQLERRVQHERVGLLDTWHREPVRDVTDEPGVAGMSGNVGADGHLEGRFGDHVDERRTSS